MERRGLAEPIPLAMVCDPLAKVIMGKGDIIVREEKRSLLPEIWSKALESRIQGPDECERQAEALPVWTIDEMDVDLVV